MSDTLTKENVCERCSLPGTNELPIARNSSGKFQHAFTGDCLAAALGRIAELEQQLLDAENVRAVDAQTIEDLTRENAELLRKQQSDRLTINNLAEASISHEPQSSSADENTSEIEREIVYQLGRREFDRLCVEALALIQRLQVQRAALERELMAIKENRYNEITHRCNKGHVFFAAVNHPAKSEREWECPNCLSAELHAVKRNSHEPRAVYGIPQILEYLKERSNWLRKEWQNGGDFKYLSLKKEECDYLASVIADMSARLNQPNETGDIRSKNDSPETIPGFTTDDDLKKAAWVFDSSGQAGAIHVFRFRERDLLALLRLIQTKAQEFERRSQPPGEHPLRTALAQIWNGESDEPFFKLSSAEMAKIARRALDEYDNVKRYYCPACKAEVDTPIESLGDHPHKCEASNTGGSQS